MRRPITMPLWAWLLALVVVAVAGVVAGSTGSSGDKSEQFSETATSVEPTTPTTEATTLPTEPTTTTTMGPRTFFDDGVWEVNVDIAAGKYKTDGGEDCYWAKQTAGDDIIDNDLPHGPATVVIEPSVATFKSRNCGTWNKVG